MKINQQRIHLLNNLQSIDERPYITYRMQNSVRTTGNMALEYARQWAIQVSKKLRVVFHLDTAFPEGNERHLLFLIDGLQEVSQILQSNGIEFTLLYGSFESTMQEISNSSAGVVIDFGYLRHNKQQREWLSRYCNSPLIAIEDNLCIPIGYATQKQEWSARTLRPKLTRALNTFDNDWLTPNNPSLLKNNFEVYPGIKKHPMLLDFIVQVKSQKPLDSGNMKGGESSAYQSLIDFITHKLANYEEKRNHPECYATSRLSAYLHFGMISPLTILSLLPHTPSSTAFIEELLIRRELAHNFTYYCNNYDHYESIPNWARTSLAEHKKDKRPVLYSRKDMEQCATTDKCWNAAMRQMIQTGFMENTMRMYWGKKIIEWTEDPKDAYLIMAMLNNKYQLDGCDANSWAGFGWCFGLHDQPWSERPIFGKIRYMNEAGLKRKYNMDAYIGDWSI